MREKQAFDVKTFGNESKNSYRIFKLKTVKIQQPVLSVKNLLSYDFFHPSFRNCENKYDERWPVNKQNGLRAEKQKNIKCYKLIGNLSIRI